MHHENYQDVLHQMRQAGLEFRDADLRDGLSIDKGKKTAGKGGKWWYRLHTFAPRNSSRRFIVGSFGSYKSGGVWKIEWDKKSLSEEALQQLRADQDAARERDRRIAEEAAAFAALSALEMWRRASREGSSPYLARKGVEGESCRYITATQWMARRERDAKPIMLPAGTLVLPLLRFDKPREHALRGVQFIKPDGFKVFGEGFSKPGCAIRLGHVTERTSILLVCEGYATGLSIRMATGRRWPVYVALDAYNLGWVVEILRRLQPGAHILICADDDWKTADHDGPNPGRNKARAVAKTTPACDFVYPIFPAAARQEKDTDFNDLHAREGLAVVERQLMAVLAAIEKRRGAGCGR